MNWSLYLNFFAAMIAIINPIGIWPVWSELTNDVMRTKVRRQIAYLVVLTSFAILTVFMVSGTYLLNFFSIDIPVFKIAGGILLLFTGISMMEGTATQLNHRDEKGETNIDLAKQRFRKIIIPMTIPLLAGPGSITTVILFGTVANSGIDFLALAIIIFLTLLLLWLIFQSSYFLEKKVDPMVFSLLTRVLGIIVAAIAIQFVVDGLSEVFPAWVNQ